MNINGTNIKPRVSMQMLGAVDFACEAKLVEFGATDGQKWEYDKWACALSTRGEPVAFDYRTGTGFRRIREGQFAQKSDRPATGRITLHDKALLYPVAPSARDVLISLGADISTFLDMPNDDLAAVDYVASELGYEKPSECVELVRALRGAADKINRLLSGLMSLEDFAEQARQMDEAA